jgi:hypothetical protein
LKVFSSGTFEFVCVFDPNFKDRFEAVANKGRAEHQKPFFSFFGELCDYIACVGFDPRFFTKARLEGKGVGPLF